MGFLVAIAPSAGVLFLFYLGIKGMVEADRRERIAQARLNRDAEMTRTEQPQKSPEAAERGAAEEAPPPT